MLGSATIRGPESGLNASIYGGSSAAVETNVERLIEFQEEGEQTNNYEYSLLEWKFISKNFFSFLFPSFNRDLKAAHEIR